MAETSSGRLRVNPQTGEVEIEGSEAFIREMLGQVEKLLSTTRHRVATPEVRKEKPPGKASSDGEGGIPGTFGEYLHEFSPKTDADKILIAGHFAQSQSEESTFSTRAANSLLLDQGEKLSNASQALKNAASAKRVFKVGKGWRVSKTGLEHLASVKGVASDAG